ncbi:NAD-dependent epimerase/dehydratase family protein [Rubrobacter marinus]|uniref:UDP-glucose 4-epimerase n=1 Tax=Rubrobacter marinus TaxID=2653852 RepID=A0A6G8PTP7_9ACTN|nr:NAD-dependent epimerase/dehydratase family protein [Rubrobacter marinus]QIN77703.1 NAD-dependent epimerase/dehydratase family protein [Rubrobacter marinus]
MKCLITGGAGFIGSTVVRHLLERGHDVTVLDNFSTGYEANLEPYSEARLVRGDIRDAEAVSGAVAGNEAVFHLAASVGNKKSIDEPVYDASHNVLGTINVLEAMRAHDVGNIVYSSSAGIFGEPQYQPVDEKHPVEPDSPYGATKLCGEKLVLSYMKLYGIKAACLRYFNVYGENQRFDAYGNVIPIFAARIARGENINIFGDGEQTRDFIDVADVAAANVAAAENPDAGGTFNIGTGTEITINRLVEILRGVTGEDFEAVYGPPRPGDVRHCTADSTRLHNVLKISPSTDVAGNLERYYAWMVRDPISIENVLSVGTS